MDQQGSTKNDTPSILFFLEKQKKRETVRKHAQECKAFIAGAAKPHFYNTKAWQKTVIVLWQLRSYGKMCGESSHQ